MSVDVKEIENVIKSADSSGIEKTILEFSSRMQIYNAGIKEIRTKLEILDEEFKAKYAYNPIHHIESA